MIRLFIGYDPREAVVYHVCVNSVINHSSQPVAVTPLALKNLRGYIERHGDGSNQFTYSRFLVPYLMDWSGWALYIDGDMLLRADIAELFKLRDEAKAVLCIHHDYKTKLRNLMRSPAMATASAYGRELSPVQVLPVRTRSADCAVSSKQQAAR